MEAKKRIGEFWSTDEGVSPVIAVILMVAITVVLAATVYVWVSGFASDQEGPEQASATANGVDLDNSGDVEWVKITLTSGENAPYDGEDVTVSITDPNGANGAVCETADYTGSSCADAFDMSDGSGDSWAAGENIWAPCTNAGSGGNMIVSASVGGTTILDSALSCDENAPT